MDNDLIQDTNLDLLQVNAVEVEYSGIAPINVDNQEHTISLDPSALSSKLDTSAFDEWTATHDVEEYSAGEGIDITDHVISYTGDPGDATPWISGNKIITSADTMQPGEFIQVLSSFDLSGNKNHFITVKGQGYYFPTNQDLKERVGVDEYLPLSSFSSYTASIASNLENNWNYTNSAYSQSLNNYYNKLDISAFSSWSSEHSGDYLTKESADTLYQPIGDYQTAGNYQTAGDYLSATDSALFYPMEGNPSGFLTGVDLSNYYEKNETSSKEEIENAITSVENIINNLSGEYYPLTSNPSGYLTAVDLTDYYQKNETSSKEEISDALTGKLDATSFDPNAFYPSSNPSGFITGVDLSDYYKKNETSSKEEISDALTGKLDTTAFTSYTSNADTTEYTAGDNIDITNHVVSGKDWTSTIESATSGKLDTSSFTAYTATAVQGIEYTGIAPIDVNNTTHEISADVWTLSGTSGIEILEDAQNKVTTLRLSSLINTGDFYPMTGNPSGFLTAHQSLSNYYTKNETSSKQQISAALTGKQDILTIAGSNSVISSINGSALSAGESYSFDRNVFIENNHVYVKNYDDSTFVMTSNLDDTYYNASLHDANITSSSRIKIILNTPVDRLVFRPCNASYAPTNYGSALQSYYTAFGTAHGNDGMLLTSDVPKTEWYIDIDRINQNTGFYYMQVFPDYNPWEGGYNLSAYLANTGWVDETLATQPWVLSQIIGQGGETIDLSAGEGISIVETADKVLISNNISAGSNMSFVYDSETNKIRIDGADAFPITATDGNTTWSADCKASAFTMGRNTSRTDIGAYGFEYRQAPSVNVSGSWYDLALLMEKFKYAIPVEAVANSGMATGQNILYVVTGS